MGLDVGGGVLDCLDRALEATPPSAMDGGDSLGRTPNMFD
jgi:hypothetical protein